jgi:hypothetical protein
MSVPEAPLEYPEDRAKLALPALFVAVERGVALRSPNRVPASVAGEHRPMSLRRPSRLYR